MSYESDKYDLKRKNCVVEIGSLKNVMASEDSSKTPRLPRGLIGRRGTPAGRGARLPSIRAPRDLTLGGIPKKVFTPNIPARRTDKPKEEEATSTKKAKEDKGKKGFDKKSQGSDRGRGRGRGRGHDVIQSHSIFEQGPSEKIARPGGSGSWGGGGGGGGSGGSGGGGGGSGGSSGGLKSSIKRDKEDDKEVLDYLLKDDFVEHSFGREEAHLKPVQLPLCHVHSIKQETDQKVTVKVKEEAVDTSEEVKTENKEEIKKIVKDKTTIKTETTLETCQDVFSSPYKLDTGELLFFQFPDIMPGTPANRDSGQKSNKTQKDTTEDELENKMSSCTLSDFSEGQMGKLVVRKSGKTQLILGNVTLDISMGTKCGFLQDVVSIQTEGKTGHMSVLGHVSHRLVCTPDFESLLKTL